MTPVYTAVLRLCICFINVETQKIDVFTLSTHSMMFAYFQIKDKQRKTHFFKKTFLMANTAMKIVVGMSFWTLNKLEINFAN